MIEYQTVIRKKI